MARLSGPSFLLIGMLRMPSQTTENTFVGAIVLKSIQVHKYNLKYDNKKVGKETTRLS